MGVLGGLFGVYFGSCRSQVGVLGGPEATAKGFERVSVGPRAAGDSEMGPRLAQLESSWSQPEPNMGPT